MATLREQLTVLQRTGLGLGIGLGLGLGLGSCERLKAVPKIWNEANICLIYKKGDNTSVKNYRPIANRY
jgi:hypothetical protein